MTRIAFQWTGFVDVDPDTLGIVAANGIGSDGSLESQDNIMGIRLNPGDALGVWLMGVVTRKFYETFKGEDVRFVPGQVVARVVDPAPGEGE